MICPICQKEFTPKNSTQKYCGTDCNIIVHRNQSRECYIKRRAKETTARAVAKAAKVPPPPVKTFADWTREAADCNMDYGTYRAQIEVFGKTYEQLKATADSRIKAAHSHVGRSVNRRD